MLGEDGDVADLDAHTLETFLWYGLTTKWGIDGDDRRQLCAGLGQTLRAADRPKLADRCTDAQTIAVQAAFDDSWEAGMAAFRIGADRSPATPPDLAPSGDDPGLAWGPIMGMVEAGTRAAVGHALGAAWETGRLTPGKRGWRGVQQQIVREVLDQPAGDPLIGGTCRDAVLAERIGDWAEVQRSPTTTAMRTRVARQLLHPIAVPDGADQALEPLTTLLAAAEEGIALTANHTLNVALVRDLADRFGWALPGFRARGEVDEILVHQLHRMVKENRLARRTGRKLVLTEQGRAALADPAVRWRVATDSLLAGDGFDEAVIGFTLTAMLDGVDDRRALEEAVLAMCVEHGWAAGPDRTPVGRSEVGWGLGELWRRCAVHGFISHSSSRDELTDVGVVAARAALRAQAIGPRPDFR